MCEIKIAISISWERHLLELIQRRSELWEKYKSHIELTAKERNEFAIINLELAEFAVAIFDAGEEKSCADSSGFSYQNPAKMH